VCGRQRHDDQRAEGQGSDEFHATLRATSASPALDAATATVTNSAAAASARPRLSRTFEAIAPRSPCTSTRSGTTLAIGSAATCRAGLLCLTCGNFGVVRGVGFDPGGGVTGGVVRTTTSTTRRGGEAGTERFGGVRGVAGSTRGVDGTASGASTEPGGDASGA